MKNMKNMKQYEKIETNEIRIIIKKTFLNQNLELKVYIFLSQKVL